MAKTPANRLDLLQGTLDMLIVRTLQWGPRHGHGLGQAIRTQSDDLRWAKLARSIPLHRGLSTLSVES
jgi:PadR family transcriptional regulator PadR